MIKFRKRVNTKAESEFDPTKVLLLSLYVGLWVLHMMLVHASDHPRYKSLSKGELNPTFVILLTESTKLIISAGIWLSEKQKNQTLRFDLDALICGLGPAVTLFKQYLPVAFLYAIANNLMITNLQNLDPTVYLLLTNSRLIMTAFMMWIFMGKRISQMKQISIIIITVGLCMQETSSSATESNSTGQELNTRTELKALGLLLLQVLCSVLASLYNETLLKHSQIEKNKPSISAANMCLYVESILLNGFAVMIMPQSSLHYTSFKSDIEIVQSSLLRQGIILTLATVGIVTSYIICKIDSLTKNVALATLVLFTTALGRIFFDYDITVRVACSVLFVSVGVHSYTFSNEKPGQHITLEHAMLSLLKTLKQLWFIPIFFIICMTIDNHNLVIPTNVDTLDLPTVLINGNQQFSIENFNNGTWLDENLHRIDNSRYLTAHQWKNEVRHQLSHPLVKTLLDTKGCRVLDIGSGSGAFSRHLLQLHEGVEILGIDHSNEMVELSKASLRSQFPSFTASVASMENSSSMQNAIGSGASNGEFHIAMIMDSLCHLPDTEAVQNAIANALQPLHVGGLLVASEIPQTIYGTSTFCKTVITKNWITNSTTTLGYEILQFGAVSVNGIYSFILKKTHQKKTENLVPTNQTVTRSQSSLDLSEYVSALKQSDQTSLESSGWPLPEGLQASELSIKRFRTAQDIVYFIVRKLNEKNIPVMLKWGTALHEFRSGLDNDFVPDFHDKDIDIGVFERHFPLIKEMAPEIAANFGWSFKFWKAPLGRRPYGRHILILKGPECKSDKTTLQIDIYDFACKLHDNRLWFPWDMIDMRPNQVLPMKGTKRISGRGYSSSTQVMYMPSDPACYLANIYGDDFRTPMGTNFSRAKALDLPVCDTPTLDATEKLEFIRQLMMCGTCEGRSMDHNVVATFANGLPVTSKLCP